MAREHSREEPAVQIPKGGNRREAGRILGTHSHPLGMDTNGRRD